MCGDKGTGTAPDFTLDRIGHHQAVHMVDWVVNAARLDGFYMDLVIDY